MQISYLFRTLLDNNFSSLKTGFKAQSLLRKKKKKKALTGGDNQTLCKACRMWRRVDVSMDGVFRRHSERRSDELSCSVTFLPEVRHTPMRSAMLTDEDS
jgi:hypothetical protein